MRHFVDILLISRLVFDNIILFWAGYLSVPGSNPDAATKLSRT